MALLACLFSGGFTIASVLVIYETGGLQSLGLYALVWAAIAVIAGAVWLDSWRRTRWS